jgi:hypothetical protein
MSRFNIENIQYTFKNIEVWLRIINIPAFLIKKLTKKCLLPPENVLFTDVLPYVRLIIQVRLPRLVCLVRPRLSQSRGFGVMVNGFVPFGYASRPFTITPKNLFTTLGRESDAIFE